MKRTTLCAAKLSGLLLASLCIVGCGTDPNLQQGLGFYDTVDAFQAELANRAANKITQSPTKDFQIVVTQSVDPIGTIYRVSSSIPVSDTACIPSQFPTSREAPGLFPGSYTLSKKLAIELGLDEAVFKGLAKLGVNVTGSDTLGLAIKDTTRQVLDDETIRNLTNQPSCHTVLNGKTFWVVRGYISGTRDFSAKADANLKLEGQITKIGNFKLEPINDSSAIAVKDEKSQSFLQIISEVSVKPSETTVTSISSTPFNSQPSGIVYIQIDIADSSGLGDELAKKIRQSSFNVAGGIEKIKSSRMPKTSQVRYFHEEDKSKAEKIREILKNSRSDASIVRLGLPAPIGQLEVWLTKN